MQRRADEPEPEGAGRLITVCVQQITGSRLGLFALGCHYSVRLPGSKPVRSHDFECNGELYQGTLKKMEQPAGLTTNRTAALTPEVSRT
jgi:hypothetical protein